MNDSTYLYPVLLAAVLGGIVLLYEPLTLLAASGAGYVLIGGLLVAYAALQSHLALKDWKQHHNMRRIWLHYFGPFAPVAVIAYRLLEARGASRPLEKQIETPGELHPKQLTARAA